MKQINVKKVDSLLLKQLSIAKLRIYPWKKPNKFAITTLEEIE